MTSIVYGGPQTSSIVSQPLRLAQAIHGHEPLSLGCTPSKGHRVRKTWTLSIVPLSCRLARAICGNRSSSLGYVPGIEHQAGKTQMSFIVPPPLRSAQTIWGRCTSFLECAIRINQRARQKRGRHPSSHHPQIGFFNTWTSSIVPCPASPIGQCPGEKNLKYCRSRTLVQGSLREEETFPSLAFVFNFFFFITIHYIYGNVLFPL